MKYKSLFIKWIAQLPLSTITILRRGVWLRAGLTLASICTALRLSTVTHSGSGAGTTGNWNDPSNWGSAGVPVNGDSLVPGAISTSRLDSTNTTSVILNQIRCAGAGGGFRSKGSPSL